MLLLEANKIQKYAGDRLLFKFERLNVYTDDKIGIVGRNGAGKTTLLRLLAGEIESDEGSVLRHCEIAIIKQLEQEAGDADARMLKELRVHDKAGQRVVSGGEATRLKIADAFSRQGALLFADEPTANLDTEGIGYLAQRLADVETLLIISHDRNLLDGVCNKIIEIENGVLTTFDGNYSDYAAQKAAARERHWFEYEQSADEKERLKKTIQETQQKASSMKKAPSRMGNSEARLHKGSTKERQKKAQQSIEGVKSRIDKIETVQKPRELPAIRLNFALTDPPRNRFIIETEGFAFSYGKEDLYQNASFRLPNGSKTALLGANGAGKTTLLNLIREKHPSFRFAPKANLGFFLQGCEDLSTPPTTPGSCFTKKNWVRWNRASSPILSRSTAIF